MAEEPIFWHRRYSLQAQWTLPLREYIYSLVESVKTHRILEVGCGTGVLLAELEKRFHSSVVGLDINPFLLQQVAAIDLCSHLVCGDGHRLPFPGGSFDLVLCHFLLLWVKDPVSVVAEMARVTRPGGNVLALAEPDYSARIDFPVQLEVVGELQRQSLQAQGADPHLGRRLGSIFNQAGLQLIQTGVLGGQWSHKLDREEWDSEWEVFQKDLETHPKPPPRHQIEALMELDRSSRQKGERILFVPTFYAWGKVPLNT